MNSVEQLKQHRSIRTFNERSVPETLLSEILESALRASTCGSMQLYSMIVTSDLTRRETLAAMHLGSDTIRTAPVVITFCVDCHRIGRWLHLHAEPAGLDNMWGFAMGFSDALLAAQNALTAAEALGLGGCFLGSTLVAAPALVQFFGCPPNVVPVATLALGHPAETPELSTRLPASAVVHRERYTDAASDELHAAYDDHSRATLERFCSIPYVGAAAKAFGIDHLAGYYGRLMYPRELIETAGAYFQAALQAQGFASDAQLARVRTVQKAFSSPEFAMLQPIKQLALSMAVVSGLVDRILDLEPARIDAEISSFVISREPTIFEQLAERGLFDIELRKRFLGLLADF